MLLCVFTVDTYGQNVQMGTAIQVARNHLNQYVDTLGQLRQVDSVVSDGETCLYLFVFSDGEWCYVSSEMSVSPVVSYGFSTEILNDTPEAFLDLLEQYSMYIISSKKSTRKETNHEWDRLMHLTKAIPGSCSINEGLLNTTGKGPIIWKQGLSNSYSCLHAYNKYCPSGLEFMGCTCGHAPVGCGAVALGMAMWYWQWPNKYHWEIMPRGLWDYTPNIQADTLASFLRHCGEISNMTYMCSGSWTLMDNIEDALHDEGYEGATKYKTSDWWPWAWRCLISSEIDNGRPVIYYGQSSSVSFWHGHYFVVDGYDNNPDRKFHINFGHGDEVGAWCMLDNIIEVQTNHDTNDYSHYNHAIVGISPTIREEDIDRLSYEHIGDSMWRTEYAYRKITIPRDDEELKIESGGSLYLEAGREIVLKPGFEARRGSDATAHINKGLFNHMDIILYSYTTTAEIGGTCLIGTKNADSWELTVRDGSSHKVFQGAGTINGNTSIIWDPIDVNAGTYSAELVLKNSYGRKIEETFNIYVASRAELMSNVQTNSAVTCNVLNNQALNECFQAREDIHPNPTDRLLTVATGGEVEAIVIYTLDGRPLGGWKLLSLGGGSATLDVSTLADGTYILTVRLADGTIKATKFIKKE